jgi:uncharacterized protein YhjY with autotransporter beta-barrel domain
VLDPSTGAVTGTPSESGSFTVTATATDAYGVTGTVTYTMAVAAPPPPIAADATSASVPANTRTEAGQNVPIDLTSLLSGEFSDIIMVTQPQHGSVTISRTLAFRGGGGSGLMMAAMAASLLEIPSQIIAIYTPHEDYAGPDSFQFAAVGPGGTSAPATVTIQVVGRDPTARAHTASTLDGQPVSVNLTTGATEGPFIEATIISITPANEATANIVAEDSAGGRTFRLDVTPEAHFGGDIVVAYTLTNPFGTSAPATVTVKVTQRPDPSADLVVQAISDAQVEAVRRYSRAQTSNFLRRAESLHGDCLLSSNELRVASSTAGYDQMTAQSDLPRDGELTAQADGAEAAFDETSAANRCGGPVGVWIGGTVDVDTTEASNGRARIGVTTTGISAGMDVRLAPNVSIGIGGGLGHESSDIGDDEGHITGDTAAIALYGSVSPARGMFVDAMAAHGWLDFRTGRIDATTDGIATGEREGQYTAFALSSGIDRVSGPLQWSLYGRTEYLMGELEAYREFGAGAYDLRFDEQDLRSFTGALGFRAAYRRPVRFGLLSTTLRGEWQHEFTGERIQGVDYADVGGPAFDSISSLGWSREQFMLSPGIVLSLFSGWDLGLSVDLRAAAEERAATGRLKVDRRF